MLKIAVFSFAVISVAGIINYVRMPRFVLQSTLNKQAVEYEINYEVAYSSKPTEIPEIKLLDVFRSNGKTKTITKHLKDNVIQDGSTQLYYEIPEGSFSCITPVFISDNTGAHPIGPLTCQPHSLTKDPLSNNENVIPEDRLSLVFNHLTNENLSYLGEKEIINRKCRLFEADVIMVESSLSENLRYYREVYKTEPDKAEITFCLDKQTAIPLEMSIILSANTPYYGNMNTELSYKATVLNIKVDEKEFMLPDQTI